MVDQAAPVFHHALPEAPQFGAATPPAPFDLAAGFAEGLAVADLLAAAFIKDLAMVGFGTARFLGPGDFPLEEGGLPLDLPLLSPALGGAA